MAEIDKADTDNSGLEQTQLIGCQQILHLLLGKSHHRQLSSWILTKKKVQFENLGNWNCLKKNLFLSLISSNIWILESKSDKIVLLLWVIFERFLDLTDFVSCMELFINWKIRTKSGSVSNVFSGFRIHGIYLLILMMFISLRW